jgi:hypothetical protein
MSEGRHEGTLLALELRNFDHYLNEFGNIVKSKQWLAQVMKGLEYDASQTGFLAVLKPWQLKAMQVVWESPEGANSRTVYVKVNQLMDGETISRASIINFLEDLREMGIFSGEERTGKGGHHWVYFPKLNEAGFKAFIVEKMITSLVENFPEETNEAIKKLNQ